MLENYWTLLKNMHCSDCTLSWHLQSILIFISIIFFSYFVNIYNYLLLIQIHKCSDNFTGKNKNPSINEDLCTNWPHGKFHLSSSSFFFGQKNVGGKIQNFFKKRVFFVVLPDMLFCLWLHKQSFEFPPPRLSVPFFLKKSSRVTL